MRASSLMAIGWVVSVSAGAAQGPWQPPEGHTQAPIWPGRPPDAKPDSAPERFEVGTQRIGGKTVTGVYDVSTPTITVYAPQGPSSGAAIVVFPGGGYRGLAIDLEGTDVCDWLVTRGVTCVLLKYRVPGSAEYWDPNLKRRVNPRVYTALEDAQRTVGLVRHRAAEWKIDPHKIGVLGFSAGGHLAAAVSTNPQRTYPLQDEADRESCRPDFAVAIYPGHLWDSHTLELKTDTRVHPTAETPPTFLLQAEDDDVDGVEQSIVYYLALKKAKVPVEMHLYPQGGHAFGLRPTEMPITRWPALVEAWLANLGMIPKS